MSYEIEVNLPNRPKGDMVAITGLGAFPNGETSPMDPELVELHRLNGGEALGNMNWPEGIKVHRAKKTEDKKNTPAEESKTEGSDK